MNIFKYFLITLALSIGASQSISAMQDDLRGTVQNLLRERKATAEALKKAQVEQAAAQSQLLALKNTWYVKAGQQVNGSMQKMQNVAQKAAARWTTFKSFAQTPEFMTLIQQGFIGSVTIGSTIYLVTSTLELMEAKAFIEKNPGFLETMGCVISNACMIAVATGHDLTISASTLTSAILSTITNPYVAGATIFAASVMFVLKKMVAQKKARNNQNLMQINNI